MGTGNYRVRVLDLKYQAEFEHMNLMYLTYEVAACDEKEAIEKARSLYMQGQKEAFAEELPFLLKLFSVNPG